MRRLLALGLGCLVSFSASSEDLLTIFDQAVVNDPSVREAEFTLAEGIRAATPLVALPATPPVPLPAAPLVAVPAAPLVAEPAVPPSRATLPLLPQPTAAARAQLKNPRPNADRARMSRLPSTVVGGNRLVARSFESARAASRLRPAKDLFAQATTGLCAALAGACVPPAAAFFFCRAASRFNSSTRDRYRCHR